MLPITIRDLTTKSFWKQRARPCTLPAKKPNTIDWPRPNGPWNMFPNLWLSSWTIMKSISQSNSGN